MLIRVLSDWHLEFRRPNNYLIGELLPHLPTDKDSILVIAGDFLQLTVSHPVTAYFQLLSSRFKHVIFVFGNHEYYRWVIDDVEACLKHHVKDLNNVHVLQNESITIDDVVFIGSTLWTDFNKFNPVNLAYSKINDFMGLIHYGSLADDVKLFTAERSTELFVESKQYIEQQLQRHKDKTTVVVTHHAPSLQSIHDNYKGSNINCCFASDMDDFIIENAPNYWIHGHVHNAFDYMISNTRIVCNPNGYPDEFPGNRGLFDNKKVILI